MTHVQIQPDAMTAGKKVRAEDGLPTAEAGRKRLRRLLAGFVLWQHKLIAWRWFLKTVTLSLGIWLLLAWVDARFQLGAKILWGIDGFLMVGISWAVGRAVLYVAQGVVDRKGQGEDQLGAQDGSARLGLKNKGFLKPKDSVLTGARLRVHQGQPDHGVLSAASFVEQSEDDLRRFVPDECASSPRELSPHELSQHESRQLKEQAMALACQRLDQQPPKQVMPVWPAIQKWLIAAGFMVFLICGVQIWMPGLLGQVAKRLLNPAAEYAPYTQLGFDLGLDLVWVKQDEAWQLQLDLLMPERLVEANLDDVSGLQSLEPAVWLVWEPEQENLENQTGLRDSVGLRDSASLGGLVQQRERFARLQNQHQNQHQNQNQKQNSAHPSRRYQTPQAVRLVEQLANQSTRQNQAVQTQSYRLTLRGVPEAVLAGARFQIHVTGVEKGLGHSRTDWLDLPVDRRPQVEQVHLVVTAPAYTGLGEQRIQVPKQGWVKVTEASDLKLEVNGQPALKDMLGQLAIKPFAVYPKAESTDESTADATDAAADRLLESQPMSLSQGAVVWPSQVLKEQTLINQVTAEASIDPTHLTGQDVDQPAFADRSWQVRLKSLSAIKQMRQTAARWESGHLSADEVGGDVNGNGDGGLSEMGEPFDFVVRTMRDQKPGLIWQMTSGGASDELAGGLRLLAEDDYGLAKADWQLVRLKRAQGVDRLPPEAEAEAEAEADVEEEAEVGVLNEAGSNEPEVVLNEKQQWVSGDRQTRWQKTLDLKSFSLQVGDVVWAQAAVYDNRPDELGGAQMREATFGPWVVVPNDPNDPSDDQNEYQWQPLIDVLRDEAGQGGKQAEQQVPQERLQQQDTNQIDDQADLNTSTPKASGLRETLEKLMNQMAQDASSKSAPAESNAQQQAEATSQDRQNAAIQAFCQAVGQCMNPGSESSGLGRGQGQMQGQSQGQGQGVGQGQASGGGVSGSFGAGASSTASAGDALAGAQSGSTGGEQAEAAGAGEQGGQEGGQGGVDRPIGLIQGVDTQVMLEGIDDQIDTSSNGLPILDQVPPMYREQVAAYFRQLRQLEQLEDTSE